MANSSDMSTRQAVAKSPYLTFELMQKLSKDRMSRTVLAKNPALPESLIREMYKQGMHDIGYYLTFNPNTPTDVIEDMLDDPDSDTRQAARKVLKERTSKSPSVERKTSWMSLVDTLQSDLDDEIDPLYEQTDAGEKLQSICTDVEDKLGIWLEPSIQAGMGGIWFYSKDDDKILAQNYDYETYNETVVDLALNSNSQTEFKNKYNNFLQDILNDLQYAPEEE